MLAHQLNLKIYQEALERSDLNQNALAVKLGVTPQNLSRWVREGYPADKVNEFARALNIKGDNFRALINAPIYRPFFRKKYKSDPSDESQNRAVDLAKFWFQREMFCDHKIAFPDLSNEKSAVTVAQTIRGFFGLNGALSFTAIRIALMNFGIVIVPISFSYFGLKKSESGSRKGECAVTVFDNVSKYVILLDTDANHSLLVFNLCHEISHIFRSDAVQGENEETFCNAVASEMMYPEAVIQDVLSKAEGLSTYQKLHAIHARTGFSRYGIAISLVNRNLLKKSDVLWKSVKSFEVPAKDFRPSKNDLKEVKEFYAGLNPNELMAEPYIDFKVAAIDGHLSGRMLAQYLRLESYEGILLVDSWKEAMA